MLTKKTGDIPSREITDKSLYLNRRKFLAGAAAVAGAAVLGGSSLLRVAAPVDVAIQKSEIAKQKSIFAL